ncbi:hypothetical protein B0H19DRAFT_1199605, partial [Mycena capillaripes]
MDGSFFFWENTGQEQQRHSPHVNQDVLHDFPASMPLEAPLAPSHEFTAPTSWDAVLSSWLP